MSIFLGSQLEDVIGQLEQGAGRPRRRRAATVELGVTSLPVLPEGRHGPQPDLAVRLHRQQVRVPGGRLVGADLLAADGAQHRGRRLAQAARRRARRARARRLRGPDQGPVGDRQGQQAGPVRGQRLLRGVARRGRAPRAAQQPDHRRRPAGADDRKGEGRCSRASACCPSASSPSRVDINWERYVKVSNIEAACAAGHRQDDDPAGGGHVPRRARRRHRRRGASRASARRSPAWPTRWSTPSTRSSTPSTRPTRRAR